MAKFADAVGNSTSPMALCKRLLKACLGRHSGPSHLASARILKSESIGAVRCEATMMVKMQRCLCRSSPVKPMF